MAQFRAVIEGQRGSASRLGHKTTGLRAVVNGWNGGVSVRAYFDDEAGEDRFDVWSTGGSNADIGDTTYLGYVDGEGKFHRACPEPHESHSRCSACA